MYWVRGHIYWGTHMYWVNYYICIGYICCPTHIYVPQYIYPIHIPNTYGRVRMKYICWTTGYMLDFGVFRLIFATFHDRFYFSHNTKKNLSPFCLLYLLDSSRSNFKNGLYIYLWSKYSITFRIIYMYNTTVTL